MGTSRFPWHTAKKPKGGKKTPDYPQCIACTRRAIYPIKTSDGETVELCGHCRKRVEGVLGYNIFARTHTRDMLLWLAGQE